MREMFKIQRKHVLIESNSEDVSSETDTEKIHKEELKLMQKYAAILRRRELDNREIAPSVVI